MVINKSPFSKPHPACTRFICLFGLFIAFALPHATQAQEQKKLEAKKARLQEEIKQINSLLSQKANERKNALTEIEDVTQKIRVRQELIEVMNEQANLLSAEIDSNTRNMDRLQAELYRLKKEYSNMIQKSYQNQSKDSRLLFLLSSKNFWQAYKRVQYMKQYTRYRKRQGEALQTKTAEMRELTNRLIVQRKEKETVIAENRKTQEALQKEKQEQERLIAIIKKKEGEYKSQIRKKQQEADEIDRRIERLIREAIAEANKKSGKSANTNTFTLTPEAKLVADNFSANKGKLIWPVERGVKSTGYGEYADPVYPGLKRFNSGVTIASAEGAKARSVFNGEVSAVIIVPGGNKAVQVRHGNYITTYYNLSKVYVKKGDAVTAKQPIGEIFSSPSSGKTELKFFIYKDTNRLNPEEWIYGM
jgi:septal ring factor EnvC (AmiA/AmiB activator)